MKKIICVLILYILSIFSCVTTETVNIKKDSMEKSDSVSKEEFKISIKEFDDISKYKKLINLYAFKYSDESNTEFRVFTGRCSAFVRDNGYSSILLNNSDEREIINSYEGDYEKIAIINVHTVDLDKENGKIIIIMFGINDDDKEKILYVPFWIATAEGKSVEILKLKSREEVGKYMIDCFFNNMEISNELIYTLSGN